MTPGASVLARNFRFMGAGIGAVAALQYALYLLVARYLGVDAYGSLAVAMTMAALAAPLCDLGMNVALVWTSSRAPERTPEVVGASLFLRFALAAPVGIAAAAAGHALGFGSEVLSLFVPIFAAAVLDGVTGLFAAVFQAREEMGWSASILLARNVAKVLAFGGVLASGCGAAVLVWAWFGAALCGAVCSAGLVRRRHEIRWAPHQLWPVLRTAWPFGSAILASHCLLQADVLMLATLCEDAAVGAYHAAFRFLVLAELLPHLVSTVVVPRSYRLGHTGGAERLGRFYRTQALALGTLGVLGSLGLAMHGGLLTAWTLGPAYAESGALLVALAPMAFVRFMMVPLADVLSSLGGQHRLSQAAWLAVAVNVACNLLLIPHHGALGAVVATGISQACMLAALAVAAAARGLALEWPRVLSHGLGAALVGAAVHTAAPGLGLPAAVALLAALLRFSPVEEHRGLVRHLRNLGKRAPSTALPGPGLKSAGQESR